MEHKIEATVLQVKWQNLNLPICTTNIPIFPWDNLIELKRQVKVAMPKHCKLLSMRKTKALVLNPLIK